MSGALVLVGTPIGNLGDLSLRARDALAGAGAICCEDTRRTGKLLELSRIPRPRLMLVNEHTEPAMVDEVLSLVRAGTRVAVVTDAGMPAISDPGELLVRATIEAGLAVEVVPGPSAVTGALAVSGLPAGRFAFEGFLPRKGAARSDRLAALAGERRTIVLFEAPHRLLRTLSDLAGVLGPHRPIALVRELTKLHEEVWRGSLSAAISAHTDREPRGEYVIVAEGAPPAPEPTVAEIESALDAALASGTSRRDAVAEVAGNLGVPRRTVYALATGGGVNGAAPGTGCGVDPSPEETARC